MAWEWSSTPLGPFTKSPGWLRKCPSVQGLPCSVSGPWNCTHSGYPDVTTRTAAAAASPVTVPRTRPGTARGRPAASTTTMTAPASTVCATDSSAMNSWAAVSRPSQAPVRTGRPRPVTSRSSASIMRGSSTANCRW